MTTRHTQHILSDGESDEEEVPFLTRKAIQIDDKKYTTSSTTHSRLRMLALATILANIAIHALFSVFQYLKPVMVPGSVVTTDPKKITHGENINPKEDEKTNEKYDSTNNNGITSQNKDNVIYGHMHIAKTGGTSLNGLLAAKYERVCGNKGYSFDAYQASARSREASKRDHGPEDLQKGLGNAWDYKPEYIGYENCDYISNEIRWDFWPKTMTKLNKAYADSKPEKATEKKKDKDKDKDKLVLELHVPCRDPIDHLMSLANHEGPKVKRVVFNCTGIDKDDKLLKKEVERAYFDFNRFHSDLYTKNKDGGIRFRCFRSIPVEPYIDYMGRYLQPRRIPADYFEHKTNQKRDKSKECVRDLPESVKDKIRKVMIENHFYIKFCNRCMGSADELQL